MLFTISVLQEFLRVISKKLSHVFGTFSRDGLSDTFQPRFKPVWHDDSASGLELFFRHLNVRIKLEKGYSLGPITAVRSYDSRVA